MKPVNQTKLHIPGKQNGNCMRAAFASLLEITIEEIPHFEDMPTCGEGTAKNPSWFKALAQWLESFGFYLLEYNGKQFIPGYFIANGKSPRGFQHSVIYKGNEMVHDPHPSKEGIEKINEIWILAPINPALLLTNKKEN